MVYYPAMTFFFKPKTDGMSRDTILGIAYGSGNAYSENTK